MQGHHKTLTVSEANQNIQAIVTNETIQDIDPDIIVETITDLSHLVASLYEGSESQLTLESQREIRRIMNEIYLSFCK
ncbi:hypothetical protein [Metabacillus litoralis]|uniref:hypothetical protein n=1 Tax=Metabacillus litoralis TaxID=152268 RepID=UPI00203E9C71|nr:hypothetical protein [Metabacillus litoralis]MCM3163726.1 hypothetical protein [Metabacillus litoralis]